MAALHDLHCHLDYMANGEQVAAQALECGSLLFANTVTPDGWNAALSRFASFDNVIVGFGMHPWFVPGSSQADNASPRETSNGHIEHDELAGGCAPSRHDTDKQAAALRNQIIELLEERQPYALGEIGLDFGWRNQASKVAQEDIFFTISSWAALHGERLLSLHSIKAARETLDILERAGALGSCTCILHWFSGSSDQLKRAIESGCYFSCGVRMLATRKGREYLKAIPLDRLVLETDAPPEKGIPYSYAELRADLESAANSIASIKGACALDQIAGTGERLLAQ